MDEKKYYYSLCQIMVTRSENKAYAQLLRLADINNIAVPKKTYYLNEKNMWYVPHINLINTDPASSDRENQLGVWRWYEVDKKQYSNPIPCDYYELIQLQNLSYQYEKLSIPQLLDRLLSGIPKPDDLHTPFLLSIAETETAYLCLEIHDGMIISTQDAIRLIEGKEINVYSLPKSHFVNSEVVFLQNKFQRSRTKYDKEAGKISHLRINLVPRTVYLKYPLPEKVTSFILHPFQTCLTEYLNHSLNRLSVEEQAAITNVLELENQAEGNFGEFIKTYLATDENLFVESYLKQEEEAITTLKEYVAFNTFGKTFFTRLIENIPELKTEYLKRFIGQYSKEIKERVQKEAEEATQDLQKIQSETKSLKAAVAELTEKKVQLDEENTRLQTINEEIRRSLSSSTLDIFTTINNLKELLAMDIFSQESTPSQPRKTLAAIQKRPMSSLVKTNETPEEIDSIDDVLDVVEGNLKKKGFTNNLHELANLILGSYLQNTPLVCTGYAANLLTEIIPLSFTAERAETFCIPTGYHDYQSLLSMLKQSASEYVILENLLGSSEEYCYLHLASDIPEKRIIFMVDFKDTLKLLPAEIYSHLFIIDADRYYAGFSSNKPIDMATVALENQELVQNLRKQIEHIEDLKTIITGSPLPQSYLYPRHILLNLYSQKTDDKKEIISAAYPEIASILSILGYSDEYAEYLQSLESEENKGLFSHLTPQ